MPEKYNLLDFLKTFGIQSTTNFDLLEMAEYLRLDGLEVIMKDEIKDRSSAKGDKDNAHHARTAHRASLAKGDNNSLIINYQNENQKGTHWVALFIDRKEQGFYFDSFGLKPLEEIYEMFSSPKVIEVQSSATTANQLIYNKEVVQHYETEICGQLCIYFLYRMSRQDKDSLDLLQRFKEIISELKALHNDLLSSRG